MNKKTMLKYLTPLLTALLLFGVGSQSQAVPYACDITNNAGTVSFRLNEAADNVKVVSSGGAVTNDLGPGVKGLTVTNLGIASGNIKVAVMRSAPAGYTQTSVDLFQDGDGVYVNKFEQARGLAVNKNPATPSFGRIYVSNGRDETTGTPASRHTLDGIYLINSDDTVALDTGVTPRTAGLPFDTANDLSPFRVSVGKDDGLLYISDDSDSVGGLWVCDADVAANATAGNVFQQIGDLGFGATNHGSIYSAWVEGSLAGNNLKVFTLDEDLAPVRSAWRYDINSGPLPWTGPTNLLNNTGFINTALKLVRGGVSNYFYASQNRSAGTDGPSIIIFSETGLITNSLAYTRSNFNASAADIFRNTTSIDISPDGTTLALLRGVAFGSVLLVPITNGVLNVAGTNSFSIGTSGASDNNRDIAYDAAGNLYIINTATEWFRIFSKGGATIATTGTDGTFNIAVPPILVSVSASVATANEQGPVNGQFTLTRSGDTTAPLTVNYTLPGTAVNGTDYTLIPLALTFAAGQTTTNIIVTPADDAVAELTETVILTVSGSANYGIGTGSATVSILDNEPTEIAFNTVVTNKLLESYAPSKVTCQVVRRGLLTSAVTVNLAYSGTATRGVDFNAPLTVSLGASVVTANFTLTPINDQLYEGDELAVVSVASGTGYAIGTPAAAYVQVIDDENPAGTVLFSDNFNTDTTSLWTVNMADPSTDFVDFNWDYSAVGIPVAPGTTDGSTRGLRFRCGNATLQIDGLSASPAAGNFTGNYRLKFDMWINYNGPMPDGGDGSTQNFDAGVGTTGDHPVWFNNPSSVGLWFTCTGDGADGDTDGDYTAFLADVEYKDDTGFYAAGTGAGPNTGIRNASHPFYALWGGQAAPADQLSLFPSQTGVANLGNAGMAWHTVVITKLADTVKWQIDGVTICTVTNDPGNLSTNVFVGYQDKFASGAVSPVPEMSFGLVDNLRVETYLSAPISITAIAIVGGNVEINFTGPPELAATAFKLQHSVAVGGTYSDDNSASLTSSGPGSFKATTALSANRFYRIKL